MLLFNHQMVTGATGNLTLSVTCHLQTVDMLPQQRSIFTTYLSCVFLPWHILLGYTPTGVKGSLSSVILALTQYSFNRTFTPTEAFNSTEVLRLLLKCFNEYVTAYVCFWTPCEHTVFPGNLCHLLVSWAVAHSVAVFRLHCCLHWVGFTRLWFRHSLSWSEILVSFLVYCAVILVNNPESRGAWLVSM